MYYLIVHIEQHQLLKKFKEYIYQGNLAGIRVKL